MLSETHAGTHLGDSSAQTGLSPTRATGLAATYPCRPILAPLVAAIESALADTLPEQLPAAVSQALNQYARLDGLLESLLDATQLAGNAERYARHLLYAHPSGLFTVVALVWRPGQSTPVHGHYTWCAYLILQGNMSEEHYTWDRNSRCAVLYEQVARDQGDTVGSHAGLEDIHRLRNASEAVAVSIHVYGVDAQRVATHVNRLADIAELA